MTATDQALDPAPRRINLAAMSSALSLVVIIAAFWAFFSWRQPGFLSSFNLLTLGRALAIDIVIGFAQMVVLATGGMNLAVGAIGVCAVMTAGYMMQVLGLPVPVAILGALALGAVLGFINGFAIVKSGVNAFVITLASANLFAGAMLILTKAVPLSTLPPEVGAFGKMRINLFTPALPVSLPRAWRDLLQAMTGPRSRRQVHCRGGRLCHDRHGERCRAGGSRTNREHPDHRRPRPRRGGGRPGTRRGHGRNG